MKINPQTLNPNAMKKALLCGIALLLSSVAPLIANNIVIYKFTSTRPWSEYTCFRPDSTPIPQNTRAGTYTRTEYWIYDQTAQEVRVLQYYSYIEDGYTVKEYEDDGSIDLSSAEGARAERLIKSNVANGYFHCLSLGGNDFEEDDFNNDGNDDSYFEATELNAVGVAAPYTVVPKKGVVPATVFPKIAKTLSGFFVETSGYRLNTNSNIHQSTLYFATGSVKLTLDAVNTQKANTGLPLTRIDDGAVLTAGTVEYGLRVVQLALEAIGYDNNDDLTIENF